MPAGRFAPSPTGPLHVGNLRTALLAWLFARSQGHDFVVRMEDLDPRTARHREAHGQLRDLERLGLDWDGEVVFQSDRFDRYEDAIARLTRPGLTYECYGTRREVHAAPLAPHAPAGAYPGTCRRLTARQRSERCADGRPPALRLRSDAGTVEVCDRQLGTITALVDDLVLRRNDGVPAYNLAVVVDDAAQHVVEVVRADDLASSAPRQSHLATLLGLVPPTYAHVPLVLGPDGNRLAKRHGAVTLADLEGAGVPPELVRSRLAASVGLAEPEEPVSMTVLVDRFEPSKLPREPWVFPC